MTFCVFRVPGLVSEWTGAFREYIIPGVEITLLPIYPAIYNFPIIFFLYRCSPQYPCNVGGLAQSSLRMVLRTCCMTGDLPELRFKLHLFLSCLIILHNKVERHESRLIHGTLAKCYKWSLTQSGVELTFAPEKYEESVLPFTWSLQGP